MLLLSMSLLRVLLLLLLIPLACLSQETITPEEFFLGNQQGRFDAIVDVRTLTEWSDGHIENATFVENLASTGAPDLILGCEECLIAVYCRTGSRAGVAIQRLLTEYGFTGTLYNALGVSQWTDAGYPLVFTDSGDPSCAGTDVCPSAVTSNPMPTTSQPPTFAPGGDGETPSPTLAPQAAAEETMQPTLPPTDKLSLKPTVLDETEDSPSVAPSMMTEDESASSRRASFYTSLPLAMIVYCGFRW